MREVRGPHDPNAHTWCRGSAETYKITSIRILYTSKYKTKKVNFNTSFVKCNLKQPF